MRPILIVLISAVFLFACKKREEATESNVFYTCSMDPQVMEKKPGLCPICKMNLTKTVVSVDDDHSLKLSEGQIKLAGIRVEELKNGMASEGISMRGVVAPDERRTQTISSRVSGRIEKLYFKNEGERIKAGDHIYDIYSEELQASIQQYLLLKEKARQLSGANVNYQEMTRAAKDKLLIWGLSENQIGNLSPAAASAYPFYSKVSGVVTKVLANEGEYVNEGAPVLTMADYHSLWVEAEAYPEDAKMIKGGLDVKVVIEAFPNEPIAGKVSFENPELEAQSRITLIRIEIENKEGKYMPGMRATVTVSAEESNGIMVPESAVLFQPTMNIVWLMNDKGAFAPMMVETGIENNGFIEIKSGLNEGDKIVVSGVYLLNSEYLLRKGSNSMDNMPRMNHAKNAEPIHQH
ncbi:MAG: efflux RND transporter periplasmic adaptor subunit [Cytophagaceae bacterium]